MLIILFVIARAGKKCYYTLYSINYSCNVHILTRKFSCALNYGGGLCLKVSIKCMLCLVHRET